MAPPEPPDEPGASGADAAASPTAAPTATASSRRPRWRRVLWWVLLGAGALVVTLVVVVVVLFATRERATDRSTDEVVEALREQGGAATAPPSVRGPDAGVYPGRGDGREYVGFSPLDEPFGPSIPATVSYTEDGCWDFRVDLNSHHHRVWMLCAGDDGLVQPVGVTATERVFPGIDFANVSTFVCDPPMMLLPAGADAGDEAASSCVGTATGLDGETRYDTVATVVGPDRIAVDGRDVDVVHVRGDASLTGAQEGTEVLDVWVIPASGLPLQVAFDTQVSTDTPFGPIDYRDLGSVTLTSLTPRR